MAPPSPASDPSTAPVVERDSGPSILDLVRLSRRPIFPPGGLELYGQIARLTNLADGAEVLDVASGSGAVLEHLVTAYGVQGQGVDHDPDMVEVAEQRARESGLADRLQFQQAPPGKLPYRDSIFDVVIGELELTARAEPRPAVRELVRVTKPGGSVVLVQPVWKAPLDAARRCELTEHLGVQPLMVVEWKRLLLDAGVESLHSEEWSGTDGGFRAPVRSPFPDFAELFSVPEKLAILRRAWSRWGWKGVGSLLVREREIHKLLTSERLLGLDLLKGIRVRESQPLASAGADAAREGQRAAEDEGTDALLEASAEPERSRS